MGWQPPSLRVARTSGYARPPHVTASAVPISSMPQVGAAASYSGRAGEPAARGSSRHAPPPPPQHSPLHAQIQEFCQLVVPNAVELRQRAEMVAVIRHSVVHTFPSRRIQTLVFGSFANGLSIWNSDVDLVVTGVHEPDRILGGYDQYERGAVANSLTRLARNIRQSLGQDVRKLQLIGRARMPIIKLWTKSQQLALDICMADDSGPRAASFVAQQATAFPALRPLVLVLKTYLRSCGFNDVANGGLSSYSLTNMVIAHLQEELKCGRDVSDLGETLYSFLVRFSEEFNYEWDAVSVHSGGIVAKASVGVVNAGETARYAASYDGQDGVPWHQRLMVDCPLTGRDISNGTFRIDLVRDAFTRAARKLERLAAETEDRRGRVNYLTALFNVQQAVTRPRTTVVEQALSHIRPAERFKAVPHSPVGSEGKPIVFDEDDLQLK